MVKPINMPQIGQDIEAGVIVEWRVKENDVVAKNDTVAIVESDKATFEVEAFEPGTVLKLLYNEGDEAKVFSPIAYIGQPWEKWDEASATVSHTSETTKTKARDATSIIREDKQAGHGKIFVAPLARKLAQKHGIDLSLVKGSGPNGRILKQDVLALISGDSAQSENKLDTTARDNGLHPDVISTLTEDQKIPFSKMRKKIAERLTHSKQTIPHFYLTIDVDMTDALAWRKQNGSNSPVKITINDIIIKAAATALSSYRKLNGHVEADKLIVRKNINIGVAVSVEEGLLVPVIPDADQNNIAEIAQISRQNTEGAQKGILKPQSVGTFTVSNLGMFAINGFLPIINPPECAILGVGKITKQVMPLDDNCIAVREMMTLSLVSDHRAVDGTYAAGFLGEIKKQLEGVLFQSGEGS
jgi:pyruvate dehydrogenase E2 component (dihydrolipoyllysine-residue acetyltransferase)